MRPTFSVQACDNAAEPRLGSRAVQITKMITANRTFEIIQHKNSHNEGLTSTIDLHQPLRRYWGYDEFRPMQERIIQSILAGQDTAVVMPTGGGKSLCYQLPAVVSNGTAIVLSRLIALMQDQAAQLAQMGIAAAVLNSSIPWVEQSNVISKAAQGAYRLLYLSPERLAKPETVAWLSRVPVAFFAIDEAHCISEWGHEFRPEYRQLSTLRANFPGKADRRLHRQRNATGPPRHSHSIRFA